jgi:serine protease Do
MVEVDRQHDDNSGNKRRIGKIALMAVVSSLAVGLLITSCSPGRNVQRDPVPPAEEYSGEDLTKQIGIKESDESTIITKAANKVLPSVVGITTIHQQEETIFDSNPEVIEGVGSGVIVSEEGHILTNDHVAGGDPEEIRVILNNGEVLEGNTLWSDPVLDLAVVKVKGRGFPAAQLGDSSTLEVGELAIAIGTPLGLQFQHTVTSGIISALNRTVRIPTERGENFMEDLIQTDASINPGNSGGPLINRDGQVIGINTVKVISAEGIGFAIPIEVAKPVIDSFRANGAFETPYVGVFAYDREVARFFRQGLDIPRGVYVTYIDPRGPAYKAGVREQDIITDIDGKSVNRMIELRTEIFKKQVGSNVTLTVVRDGQPRDFTLTLVKRPDGE